MDNEHPQDEKRIFSRLDVVRSHIEGALDLFEAGGPWPTVVTLARASGQYLADRLRREGKLPFLSATMAGAQAVLGVSIAMETWKRRAVGKADLFKHDNEPDVPDEVVLFAGDVTMSLLTAIADYSELTGAPTDRMLTWAEAHLNRPGIVAFRRQLDDPAALEAAMRRTAQQLAQAEAERAARKAASKVK